MIPYLDLIEQHPSMCTMGLGFLMLSWQKVSENTEKVQLHSDSHSSQLFLACLVEWPSLSSPHWQFLKLCFWPTSAVLYKYCCARYPFATSLCFEPKGCINVKAVILESPAQFMALSIKEIQECRSSGGGGSYQVEEGLWTPIWRLDKSTWTFAPSAKGHQPTSYRP